MTTRAVTKGMTFVSSVAGAADSRASWAAVESGVPATRTTSPRSWWCSAPMTISLPWTQLGGKSDAFTLTSTCTRLSPSPADFDGAEPIVGLLQFPFPPGQSVITCSCKPIKASCNVSSGWQLDHHWPSLWHFMAGVLQQGMERQSSYLPAHAEDCAPSLAFSPGPVAATEPSPPTMLEMEKLEKRTSSAQAAALSFGQGPAPSDPTPSIQSMSLALQ
mmetsp:Transcript_29794/g.75056  ORF Transcript_29794/g.75056 Transcript_29794/m.75056 type:complete len:218 (-) Transcript_29794:239-892(-)